MVLLGDGLTEWCYWVIVLLGDGWSHADLMCLLVENCIPLTCLWAALLYTCMYITLQRQNMAANVGQSFCITINIIVLRSSEWWFDAFAQAYVMTLETPAVRLSVSGLCRAVPVSTDARFLVRPVPMGHRGVGHVGSYHCHAARDYKMNAEYFCQ